MEKPEFPDDQTIHLLNHSEKLIERSKNIIKKMDTCSKVLSTFKKDSILNFSQNQDFSEQVDTKENT